MEVANDKKRKQDTEVYLAKMHYKNNECEDMCTVLGIYWTREAAERAVVAEYRATLIELRVRAWLDENEEDYTREQLEETASKKLDKKLQGKTVQEQLNYFIERFDCYSHDHVIERHLVKDE
jgi:hypothetical protein